VKITGWTLDQIDAAPGHFCDWVLAFAEVEGQVARDKASSG
jgi:hypothetical protein